jgi:hypothetical protein
MRSASKENFGKLIDLIATCRFHRCDEIIKVALMKGDKSSDGYKRHLRMEEDSAAGLLNFVVAQSIAAVTYADWMRWVSSMNGGWYGAVLSAI